MKDVLILAFSLDAINQAVASETTYTFKTRQPVSAPLSQGTYTTRRTQSGSTTSYTTTYERANRSSNERAAMH